MEKFCGLQLPIHVKSQLLYIAFTVSNRVPEQELSLEELIEQGLKNENLRPVFDRAMKKVDTANAQKSGQDADIQLSEPAACVTVPASNVASTNSTDSNVASVDKFDASSAEGLFPAAIITSSAAAQAPETSSVVSLESSPQPSELCQKLKSTLVDFFNSLQQKQSCNAGDPTYSDSTPMELPVPSADSANVLQPLQAVASIQVVPVCVDLSQKSIPSSSNTLSDTSVSRPVFMTSILNSGRSSHNEGPVSVISMPDDSASPSNVSFVPNLDRSEQPSPFQSMSSSFLSVVPFLPPEALASTFAAPERNFMAAPVFSVGASGEERDRSPKKSIRRMARKF